MVRWSEAIEARRYKNEYQSQKLAHVIGRPPTWSSALLAFNIAMSMSRSPSPFALYAESISRRLGGGGYLDEVNLGYLMTHVSLTHLFKHMPSGRE